MTIAVKPIGGCKRCGRPWPARAVEELYAQGWGDAGTLCPTCRADRNARAAATAGRIAAGIADAYASAWGAGSRKVEIRELPAMAVRSAWAVGPDTSLDDDVKRVWSELGDGAYLVTMIAGDARIHVAVQVYGDDIDIEPISEADVAMLPALARALNEEVPGVPA